MWIAGEVHSVHPQIRVVALEPFHRLAIRGQAVLDEQVSAQAHDVGRVPHRLDLRRDEVLGGRALQALLNRDPLVVIVVLVRLVRQPRPRSLSPLEFGVLLEVLAHEVPVGEVLEVPASEGVGRGHDLVADGEQNVAGRHLRETGVGAEVGRDDRLIPLQRRRPVDDDAVVLKDLGEVVKLGVGLFDGFGGTRPPHSAHFGVDRHFLRGRRLLGRNDRIVRAPQNDPLEGVEVVP